VPARLAAVGAAAVSIAVSIACEQVPAAAANASLKPSRHVAAVAAPDGCVAAAFEGDGVELKGWRCAAADTPRATLILVHGIADNRASWRIAIGRLTRERFDVIAYDSRAHGESGGSVCSYGFLEKRDLHRVLDVLDGRPIVLIGASLGAAIALQAAAGEPRIAGVVAAETFSDLRTVAVERAPFFLTTATIRKAFAIAEAQGGFPVDAVSPVRDAPRITAPVLLIHGAADVDTPLDHSRRVFAALGGPKRLLIVDGAGHNHSLSGEATWRTIDRWLDDVVDQPASRSGPNRPAK
jgi:uncharacterized protein